MGDIAGIWVVSEADRKYLPSSVRSAPPTVVLEPNGHFRASGLPGEIMFEPGRGPELVSGEGTWSLELLRPLANQHIQLSFHSIEKYGGPLPHGAQLYVSGGGRTPVIFYYHGDPDEGVRIAFDRQSS